MTKVGILYYPRNPNDWVSMTVNLVGSLRYDMRLTHCVALVGVHVIEITTNGVYICSRTDRLPAAANIWYVDDAQLASIWYRVGQAFDNDERLLISTFLQLLLVGTTNRFTCSSFCWWLLTGQTAYQLSTPKKLYEHVQRQICRAS